MRLGVCVCVFARVRMCAVLPPERGEGGGGFGAYARTEEKRIFVKYYFLFF